MASQAQNLLLVCRILVKYQEIHHQIAGAYDKDADHHIEEAFFDIGHLFFVIRFDEQLYGLDDDEDQKDKRGQSKHPIDDIIDERNVPVSQDACSYFAEVGNLLHDLFFLAIDRFHDLFSSYDDEHAENVPSDDGSCFFLGIRICAKDKGDDARHQDDKHSAQHQIDSDLDEREKEFVIERLRYFKSFDLAAGRGEDIVDI